MQVIMHQQAPGRACSPAELLVTCAGIMGLTQKKAFSHLGQIGRHLC